MKLTFSDYQPKIQLTKTADAAIDFQNDSQEQISRIIRGQLGSDYTSQFYVYNTSDLAPILDPYVSRLDRDSLLAIEETYSQDNWHGILNAVDYLMMAFNISLPIEVIRDPQESYMTAYAIEFEFTGELLSSELMICGPTAKPSIPLLAHEVWHVRQNQLILSWFARHQSEVHLGKINPSAPENRGLIYELQNMVYVFPDVDQTTYHTQLVEAEAEYIQRGVIKLCS